MSDQATAQSTYTDEAVERMASTLTSAPVPARPMSKQKALDKLAPALKAARDRGHTLQGLVEQLEQQGLRTHVRAVSGAIARLDTRPVAREKRVKRTPAATAGAQA